MVISGGQGEFAFPGLEPGLYRVSAELVGFSIQVVEGLQVGVGASVEVPFTLRLATVQETVTVTGAAPIVEVTSNTVGTNISNTDIDSLPAQGRQQFSLMQLVPGLTPVLRPGTFEGTQFAANGRDIGSNLFLIDGVYNNDDRMGSHAGTQSRITLDSMAEFQVLVHQYGAEYGGSSGVVVNAVTKSGTNNFHGRGFGYWQRDEWNAANHFLKINNLEKSPSEQNSIGANIGGPIIRNKAFFFVNVEKNNISEGVFLDFADGNAGPLAVPYQTNFDIKNFSYFIRGDVQAHSSTNISYRLNANPNETIFEGIGDGQTEQAALWELSKGLGDSLMSLQATTVIGNNLLNEVKVSRVNEPLQRGDRQMFDSGFSKFVGLNGREQFDFGARQNHPDYTTGTNGGWGGALMKTYLFSDDVTYTTSQHTVKAGFGFSDNGGPIVAADNAFGVYTFTTNDPFDPADRSTYPELFTISLGQFDTLSDDTRYNFYVADKWQPTDKLTLNIGVRYDKQDLVDTNNAFSPRLGFAYDLLGDGRTLIRGGFGKFYELQLVRVKAELNEGLLIPVALPEFEIEDPSHPCMNPVLGVDANGVPGLAEMSGACKAAMADVRDRVNARDGTFVNNQPQLDGPRKMGYLYGFSGGVRHQVGDNVAVSVDYSGSRAHDQTGFIDINEPINGVRPGVDGFDPTGSLIPAVARGARFRRVLQLQTRDDLNQDYNGLEVAVEKRMADRWAGRLAYTYSRARDVNGGTGGPSGATVSMRRYRDDYNPRDDYGIADFNNQQSLALGGNVNVFEGLSIGAIFRYYTGPPVNERTGLDSDGDGDGRGGNGVERPVAGVDDLGFPIVSPLAADGRAIRNGMDTTNKAILDLRLQYVQRLVGSNDIGFFLEIYNALDRVNFGQLEGNRRSSAFNTHQNADFARTVQLGVRYTF
jgi:hypothetical protein